ncbi:MAG TPA: tape measure protein, partial [Firmicutes bacterium]|nr:tape measure protein [Bacillota bacterium]
MALKNLFVVLSAHTGGFHAEIDKASRTLKKFSMDHRRDFDELSRAADRAFAAIGAAASVGFGLAAKAGLDFNSRMQQAQIAFTTMLGDAEKAKSMLKELKDFADVTPFEFPELTDAAKKMLAFGFSAESIMPTLKAVGDAAAGLGLSGGEGVQRMIIALGQMSAKQKVSAEEMRQLTEAGVNGWKYLAEATGKSTAEVMKLAERGLIPADAAIKAIVRGMEKDFPNMMDAQSKSFAGLMSTLRDKANSAFGGVLKPAFDWLTNVALPRAIEKVAAFTDTLEKAGTAAAFKTILPSGLVDGLQKAGDYAKKFFDLVVENGPTVKAVFAGIAAAVATIKLAEMLGDFLRFLGAASTPMGRLVLIVGGLVTLFVDLKNRTTETYNAMDDLRRGVAAVAREGQNATHIMQGFGRALDKVRTNPLAGIKSRTFGSVEEYVASEFGPEAVVQPPDLGGSTRTAADVLAD